MAGAATVGDRPFAALIIDNSLSLGLALLSQPVGTQAQLAMSLAAMAVMTVLWAAVFLLRAAITGPLYFLSEDGDATECGQDETSPFADLPLHDPVHADPPPTPPEHPDPWLVATAALIASLPAPAARIDVRVNLTTLLGLQDYP